MEEQRKQEKKTYQHIFSNLESEIATDEADEHLSKIREQEQITIQNHKIQDKLEKLENEGINPEELRHELFTNN